MDLFQCWHHGFHRILRTEPCHFGGGFFNIVMFGRRDRGCAASKSKWFLTPHLTNSLTAAQKEVPRNLRDPEADNRLGKRKKPRSACKTAASTQAEAGERRGARGEQRASGAAPPPPRSGRSLRRRVTLHKSQPLRTPRGRSSGDRRMDERMDEHKRQPRVRTGGGLGPARLPAAPSGTAAALRREDRRGRSGSPRGLAPSPRPQRALGPPRPRPPLSERRGKAEDGDPDPAPSPLPSLRSPGSAPGSE